MAVYGHGAITAEVNWVKEIDEDVLEADGTKTSATTRTIPVAVDIQDVERFMQDIIILRQLRQTVLHGHGAITVTAR